MKIKARVHVKVVMFRTGSNPIDDVASLHSPILGEVVDDQMVKVRGKLDNVQTIMKFSAGKHA